MRGERRIKMDFILLAIAEAELGTVFTTHTKPWEFSWALDIVAIDPFWRLLYMSETPGYPGPDFSL